MNKQIRDHKTFTPWAPFSSLSKWINDTTIFSQLREDNTEAEEYALPFTKGNKECFICEEEFEVIKLKDSDEWVFTNAIKVKIDKAYEIKVHA